MITERVLPCVDTDSGEQFRDQVGAVKWENMPVPLAPDEYMDQAYTDLGERVDGKESARLARRMCFV